MKVSRFTSAVAAVLFGSAVQADTISIQTFDIATWSALTAGGIVENFENTASNELFAEDAEERNGVLQGQLKDPLSTNVGTFASLGGSGSGTTCDSNFDGDCTQVALQYGDINGQGNIVPDPDGYWSLSSNDTSGISWTADTGGTFKRLIFGVRDAADQRNISVTISTIDGVTTTASATIQNEVPDNNDRSYLVVISFSEMMETALVEMRNSGNSVNDAFTIDGVAAVVPLPASALLLLGGIGALGVARRRRRA